MRGSFLGPEYSDAEIQAFLDRENIPYTRLPATELFARVAELVSQDNVIGWFQGRMEFGPRSLGARSIIGDARSPQMQETMNLKIKFRESFRPFAPSVLREKVDQWFDLNSSSPYMLLVAPVRNTLRRTMTEEQEKLFGLDKLHVVRSEIPAVTHIDYSARVQTVHRDTNPVYHELISAFDAESGCPVIVNTSFNVRGEPPVCSPNDAFRCFMRTGIDYLVLGHFLVDKKAQQPLVADANWQKEFALD